MNNFFYTSMKKNKNMEGHLMLQRFICVLKITIDTMTNNHYSIIILICLSIVAIIINSKYNSVVNGTKGILC